jgi:signal peptidase II
LIARRARVYDALALLTAIITIGIDQWTKSLVVTHLGPPEIGPRISLLGQYLTLYYITNSGAAFSMFNTNGPALLVLITLAVAVIIYFYMRMLNAGPLLYKLIFGFIIGGAAGNLLDRFTHGSVVDFIWFQIPQINFSFAIFNIADAAITVGVILLFATLLFGGARGKAEAQDQPSAVKAPTQDEIVSTRVQEQDAQP